MPLTSILRRITRILLPALMLGVCAASADSTVPRLYRITTETGMPHLEENLRNLTTRETRCLAPHELFKAFPVLQYAALHGCSLAPDAHLDDPVSYDLVCDGGQQTKGRAVWTRAEDRLTGTLNVKLGGKNMTFYQRVTAVMLGECAKQGTPQRVSASGGASM